MLLTSFSSFHRNPKGSPKDSFHYALLVSPGLEFVDGFLNRLRAMDPHSADATPQSRVEQVSQSITENVYPEYNDAQDDTRPDRHPRRQQHVTPTANTEHPTPAGSGWRDTIAEEAHRRLSYDHIAEGCGKYDDYGSGDVGKDMQEKDPHITTANSLCGSYILALLQSNDGASDDSRVTDTIDQTKHDDYLEKARPDNGYETRHNDQPRETHGGIDEPSDQDVDLASILFEGRAPLVRLPVERVDQTGQEASFAFHHRGAVTALTTTKSGVEQVPEGISEHVEGVDDNRQAEPRPERQPGRLLHVLTPFNAEQTSPVRTAGGQPESEEAQRSQAEDVASDADAENDDDDRHNIGYDMTDQGSHSSVASRLCRQKVIILLNGYHGASDDSGSADASGYPQDQDDLGDPRPHDGHDR